MNSWNKFCVAPSAVPMSALVKVTCTPLRLLEG
jgi:hypothetical protein